MLVLWRKPLNVETADYVQIPWVWPRGVLPKTQKRSNAPHAGHAFATNPLLSPWVARGLPGGRPLGMAADTSIIIIRQDAPLGFLLQSKFVCNGELVNSHNYLTNGA